MHQFVNSMETTKYRKELEVCETLAKIASEEILNFYYGENLHTEMKSNQTPVTEADLRSNEILVAGIQKAFPLDGIVSEEMDNIAGERTWYIDPIDGTKGFIGRSDHFAIHIGLVENESPVLGVVYKPTTGEMYLGTVDGGAYRKNPNGKEIQLKVNPTDDELRLMVNRSFLSNEITRQVYDELEPTQTYVGGSQGLRMMRVAEGFATAHTTDGYRKCGTWDLCGPQAIVEAAGGYVATLNNEKVKYTGQRYFGLDFVVTNSERMGKLVGDTMVRHLP
jgi:3'(2'), 5'-bisphosphate nucleotidase